MKRIHFLGACALVAGIGCTYVTEDVGTNGSSTIGCPSDDSGATDESLADGAMDTGPDASAFEGSVDTGVEASAEASVEASVEAGFDASESGVEASVDAASTDATADATADAALDAASDSGAMMDAATETGAGPYIRQTCQVAWTPRGQQTQSCTLPMAVLAGSAVVAFSTEYNINGSPAGSGTPSPMTVTDSESGSYAELGTAVNDQPDWEATGVFARFGAASGSLTVTGHYAGLEWQGVLAVEVVGVSSSTGESGKLVLEPAKKTNTIVAPSVAGSFVLAIAQNASDDNPPNATPLPGTGFSSFATAWNWNGLEGTTKQPTTQLEYGTGSVATFTPTSTDNFIVIAVGLQ